MKEKLTIINKEQFGSLTDSLKWCQYLRDRYDITFLCFDSGRSRLYLDGIKVIYISSCGPKFFRAIRFFFICCINILKNRSKVLVVYFNNCHLFKLLFPKIKMQMDIRTLAVLGDKESRSEYNEGIKYSSKYFDIVSVISERIRDVLGLNGNNTYILPLGADIISDVPKDYSEIKLLYVGTLNGRRISDTIAGLYDFISNNKDVVVTYDIVGDGFELNNLKKLVKKLGLMNVVTFHGHIPYDELSPFYAKCNVGVSYVPMTDYYDNQPPTKVYEYALSGLFQIATSTSANRGLISNSNGVLIKDNSDDFSFALSKVYAMRNTIDEIVIRSSLSHSTWTRIVHEDLISILEKLK